MPKQIESAEQPSCEAAALVIAGRWSASLLSVLSDWVSGVKRFLVPPAIPVGYSLLAVGALWVGGIAQAVADSGSWMIAALAIVIGALMIVLGLTQSSLVVGEFHWVVRVAHLLLGLLTIGIGHMAAARAKKNLSV